MKRSPLLRSITVGVALACASLGLAACAGAGNNNKSAGATSVLTIQGDAGDPTLTENFNPFSSTQLEGTRLIYEPLEVPSSVDGTYTPFLATGYSFSNPTTLTYTLRTGVKWSDGHPFSAADVVYTFNLLKQDAALDTTGVWTQLRSVTGSRNSVTMTFNAPSVPFASVVAAVPIVPEHVWTSVKDPAKFANTKPVGTGPFTLQNFAPTEYTFSKNASYWQAAKIAPTQVKFPAQSSNQSTNQLDVTSGKFDWSYNFLPNVKQTFVARDSAHNTYWFPPAAPSGCS